MNRLTSVRISRLLLTVITQIQCYNVLPVRSSHWQLNNHHGHRSHTTSTVDNAASSKTVLPVWVIIVIVLLILMALCFCIGLFCYRFACGKRYYYRGRHRRTRVVRVTPSHVNHENFQGIERSGVCTSGENPINKEADIIKQVGQLSSTLYQSEAPPRYEDVIQIESPDSEVDELLDDQHDHGSIHHIRSSRSPPPNYQCIN
jgi:hypothetical protein